LDHKELHGTRTRINGSATASTQAGRQWHAHLYATIRETWLHTAIISIFIELHDGGDLISFQVYMETSQLGTLRMSRTSAETATRYMVTNFGEVW
jgi:hypothetical protein